MNLSTTLSDSFDNSEDENKELVNKCNTTDKTQYTIAFDSNESRYGHNMVASSNFDYLTSSIYNCAKNRQMKLGENGNTESPQSVDTVTNVTNESTSDDTLSYHTLSNNSPHCTLNPYSNSNFHEGNTFLPIYDLKASSTSISPDSNQPHAAGGGRVHSSPSQRNAEYTQEKKCEQEEKQNRLNSRSIKASPETRESALSNLNCHSHSHRNQTPSVNQGPSHLRTSSNIISPCSLLPPAHEMLQQQQHPQQILTISPHLQHLYENRLKHASPIREEDEPSTDSSRADVEMVSDSEKGTPSSTSDSSPLAPPGKSSVFNGTTATNSRSGPWSSSQLESEFSSDALTNRSEINRNSNLRMSSGFTSNTSSRPAANSASELPRQNMAEWLKKTSMMATPRGFFRQRGGSEPPTPVSATGHQMCSGHPAATDHRYHQHHHHGYNHHHMAAMRSPSSANYGCVSHHQPHYFAEGRCCCTGHPSVGGQPTASSSHRQRRQFTDNVNSEQVSPCKDTIYVCYPNYSLPDLSFLNSPNANTSLGDVCLSPTKPLVRPPVDRCSGSSFASNASTLKSASKTRPKSLNDVASLTKSALAKVKDWESISFLLSPEVKAILGAKGLVPRKGASFFPENKNSTNSAHTSSDAVTPLHQVKLRARSTALAANKIKRYSLQEPVQSTVKSPAATAALTIGGNRRGLVRSETLPAEDAGYLASGGISSHCRLSHPSCVISASNTCCCHPPPPPPPAPSSCCHHRGFSLCCDSSHHRQSLIIREDYIETLKELLTMQDAEREVGQILGALSPSVEKKVAPGRTSLVNEEVSGVTRVDVNSKSPGTRPNRMILKSPGECKPIVPPKPSSLGASPSKFKSFIPVPKTPARNCSPPVASKSNATNTKLPSSQPLVRCTKPTKNSQKKVSK